MSWIAGWPAELAPPLALDVIVRASLILGLGCVVARSLRAASAATRHCVWAVAFGLLVLVPFGTRTLPSWEIPVAAIDGVLPIRSALPVGSEIDARPASAPDIPADPRSNATGADSASPGPPDFAPSVPRESLARWVLGAAAIVWLIGAALLLGRLGLHAGRIHALIRRSRRVPSGILPGSGVLPRSSVRLVLSDETPVPLTSGFLRPTIVLPAEAEAWPASLVGSALRHELAHVERRDFATHLASRIACALYWPNPLVWHAARRLAAERERACDDRVLAAGESPREYARHLVGLARRLRAHSAAALAMPGKDDLAERVHRIVQPATDRRPLTRARLALIGFALGLAALPIMTTEILPRPDVRPFMRDLQDTGVAARVRAAWRAGALESRAAVDPLVERLSDEHPAVRGVAAWALGEIKDERALEPLTRTMEADDDPRVREAAALAIGEIGHRAGVAPLASAFRNDADLRPAVLWALGEIDHSSSAAALDELRVLAPEVTPWLDGDLATRVRVGRTGGEAAASGERSRGRGAEDRTGRFVAELARGGAEERTAALLALGRLADPAAVAPVMKLLEAPEPGVRADAAWVLGRIANVRAVDALLGLLRDDEIEVRAMAVWALDEIGPAGS